MPPTPSKDEASPRDAVEELALVPQTGVSLDARYSTYAADALPPGVPTHGLQVTQTLALPH